MSPLYDYQCDCGVRFEAPGRMAESMKPAPCPSCGGEAPRVVPDDVGGIFKQGVSGPVPQNTGISQLDAHIDRVIGKSAEAGWTTHSDRVDAKRRILADNPGTSGHDITENPDGSFGVLSEKERGVRDRAQAINSLAIESLKQAAPSGKGVAG